METPREIADVREDGRQLVADVLALVTRYVVFRSAHQSLAVVLWVLHTYVFAVAFATPYLLVLSPEKRSGKSRLLEVIELLVASAWRLAGASEAALFRKIDQDRPALLLDEVDAVFGSNSERTEPLRAILNAGNRRGANVARCVGQGTNQRAVDFNVFCPKVLAGIETGRLPDTVRDRSVVIRLARKKRTEAVERFRARLVIAEADALKERMMRWAEQNLPALADADPRLPEELNDRAWEAWEPLVAIADLCGIGDEARSAAVALSGSAEPEDDSIRIQLLADIHQLLDTRDEPIASKALCERLNQLEESPWGNWAGRRAEPGLNQRDLASLLHPFRIKPRTVRIRHGNHSVTAKGYHPEQFADAWDRYLDQQSAQEAAKAPSDSQESAKGSDSADNTSGSR